MFFLHKTLFGPRVPARELVEHRLRYRLPAALMTAATLILLISSLLPYWRMTLFAPQYPKGLHVRAYLNHLEGDVSEIDRLNHYIGMRSLNDAAHLERSLSLMAIVAMGLLLLSTLYIHSPWAAVASLPALLFPVGFLIDLHLWMRNFGQNLDPHAALSSSIEPFTPPVLGVGMVGQFKTLALPDVGLILATVASLFVLCGLYFHRRAYRPLFLREVLSVPGPARRSGTKLAEGGAG